MLLGLKTWLFIAALALVYIYYKYVIFDYWRKRGVFNVKPVVPTGTVTDILIGKVSIGQYLHDSYLKYKKHRLFGIYMLYKPNLVIADFDLIRTVLTKEFGSFHDRGVYYNEKIDPLTGNLFVLPGKKWRNLRVKLSPTFTSGKIKQMFLVQKECSEELAKRLEIEALRRNGINFKEIFASYSLEVIMSVAFGIKSNCIQEPNNIFRYWSRQFLEIGAIKTTLFIFVPQLLEFFSIPATSRGIINFYTKLFQDNVEYRKTHKVVKHDFMNLLIQLMEKGYVEPDEEKKDSADVSFNMNKLTMLEAAAQAFVFIIAGFDTTSSTMTFCLYELALHQDIQDKVQQEVDETLEKHGELSYDAVNEMTYFNKVVQETLRKYPPVPLLNRMCTKEIVLPTTNIRISEGTMITIPILGVHRDPSVYPDPDKFDPERFNADQVAARHPFAYLPFGEGPRICIGSRFGLMQTKIGILSVLTKYKVKPHQRTPSSLVFDASSVPLMVKGGVHLIMESR